jgi:glycosyltransferase involved in cell wall biosynthesis
VVAEVFPLSVVIPTRNRVAVLRRTLASLAAQSGQPAQLLLVDASNDHSTHKLCCGPRITELRSELVWMPAQVRGAASQRNEGMGACHHPVIGFFDDDILFEPDCIARLWRALQCDPGLGGVNAMIINQRYEAPGRVSRMMFRLMAGASRATYAGRILGPAVNLLPEDRADLPEVVPVEWLNTTCTLYRREALPHPPFLAHFTGYSLMEDVALSVTVAKRWKLANVRSARIYHDSQPGAQKDEPVTRSRMELVNRHHLMTEVMTRRSFADYARFVLWECFQLGSCAIEERGGSIFWGVLRGKLLGFFDILTSRSKRATG